jgi:hypothetical protein
VARLHQRHNSGVETYRTELGIQLVRDIDPIRDLSEF